MFLGLLPNIFGTLDTILGFSHLLLNFVHSWKLISLSLERITNSLNLLSDMFSFPINDDINRLSNFLFSGLVQSVIELFFVEVRFSFGRSENESLQSSYVFLINYTSNIANLNSVISDKSLLLSLSLFARLSLELIFKLWDHLKRHS